MTAPLHPRDTLHAQDPWLREHNLPSLAGGEVDAYVLVVLARCRDALPPSVVCAVVERVFGSGTVGEA